MAGEEISWGQRIFGWATPDFFRENNIQGETNFHNMDTQLFQNILYFGGWLLLVALPFFGESIKKFFSRFKSLKFLGEWLPPTYFLLIFAAAFGFVNPIWADGGAGYSSILFSILGTAAILIYAVLKARRRLAEILCLVLGAFATVLLFNLLFSEVWYINAGAPTEYIELFISLGILLWAISLHRQLLPPRPAVGVKIVSQRHH
jgi:hypothetical protein